MTQAKVRTQEEEKCVKHVCSMRVEWQSMWRVACGMMVAGRHACKWHGGCKAPLLLLLFALCT